MAETIQQGNQRYPVCRRTSHSPPESMANPGHPLQTFPNHNHSGNQRDTKNTVQPTATTRTLSLQVLNKLLGMKYCQIQLCRYGSLKLIQLPHT